MSIAGAILSICRHDPKRKLKRESLSSRKEKDLMASVFTVIRSSFCSSTQASSSSSSSLEKQSTSDCKIGRREVVLRSFAIPAMAAIFNFSGTKPGYLGIQKSSPSLALCPATSNCVSTSEDISDSKHYAPPWNYNPDNGSRKSPISREEAMTEILDVLVSTKPDKFTPRVVEKKDDYVRVEYESPIFGFVDDVEFWFRPSKKFLVEYRSASRSGNFDFDVNRKRIKSLREELEKKGWASESSF